MYVIKKTNGHYVAKPGSAHSYTVDLERARKFETREAALRDLCPVNERIVDLNDELDRFRR